MKIKIENKKLQDMLNYLKVDTLFPTCILSTKDCKLYSAQTEAYGYAYRFALFNKDFFDFIDNDNASVKVDVEQMLKIIKTINPEEILTLQYPSSYSKEIDKLNILGKIDNVNLPVSEIEEGENKEGLIFKMDKSTPILKPEDEKIRLEGHIIMKLESFKAMAEKAASLSTEFFSFNVEKGKFKIRIGDLHDASATIDYNPQNVTLETKEDINAVFTKGITEIAKTFTADDIDLRIKTDCPVWISSQDKGYKIGLLLPPYIPEE